MLAVAAAGAAAACGTADRETRSQPPASAAGGATAPGEQVVLGLPRLGTLLASCGGRGRLELRYRAGAHHSETVSVKVGSRRLRRRSLPPERDLRVSAPVTRTPASDGVRFQSPPIRLVAVANAQPFEVRATVELVLASAEDGTGECVARSARAGVATTFH